MRNTFRAIDPRLPQNKLEAELPTDISLTYSSYYALRSILWHIGLNGFCKVGISAAEPAVAEPVEATAGKFRSHWVH